jgi:uncharacterized membrane protein YqhA
MVGQRSPSFWFKQSVSNHTILTQTSCLFQTLHIFSASNSCHLTRLITLHYVPDMFLVGTVMFVFGTGLYELFISNTDNSYGSNLFGLFKLPVSSYAHSSRWY